jgi:hypothetical protein
MWGRNAMENLLISLSKRGDEKMSKLIRTFLIGIAPLALLGLGAQAHAQATDVDCNGCVDLSDIASEAISASRIRAGAVTSSKIRPEAVTTGKIADRAVTKEKIKKNAVTTSKIRDGAVTTSKIKSGAVTNTKLAPEVRNQIDALLERVDALEAANVGLNGGDLDGNIYCMQGLGRELFGGDAPGVFMGYYRGVLTFTSSTQVAFSSSGEDSAWLNTNTGIVESGSDPAGGATMHNYFVMGNMLTVPTKFGDLSLLISPDGNFLFGTGSSVTEEGLDANLVMAVRAESC